MLDMPRRPSVEQSGSVEALRAKRRACCHDPPLLYRMASSAELEHPPQSQGEVKHTGNEDVCHTWDKQRKMKTTENI